jgi:hypothetical protein
MSEPANECVLEPLVRLGLIMVGIAMTLIGWFIDWRGYVQGIGFGISLSALVWHVCAVLRKPNNSGQPRLAQKGHNANQDA